MEIVQELRGHAGRVWNVGWNPEGNILTSCGEDKTIRLWNVENSDPFKLELKCVLRGVHERTIRKVSWSPDGERLASASFDGTVAIWDKNNDFKVVTTLVGHENEVKSVCWSPCNKYLATGSRDKTVFIWELGPKEEEFDCVAVLTSHTQDVKTVAWNPVNSDIVASGSYDDTINIYKYCHDSDEWEPCCVLRDHESTIWSLHFNKDGTKLASGSEDKTVKIWQCLDEGKTWRCVCTISGDHDGPIYDIAWCHLTGWLATACGDNGISVYAEDTECLPNETVFNRLYYRENSHEEDVNSVAWNPVIPGILASASDDGSIKIWKVDCDHVDAT